MLKKNITDCFGIRIRRMLEKEDWKGITEIRVRSGKPLILKKGAEEHLMYRIRLPCLATILFMLLRNSLDLAM